MDKKILIVEDEFIIADMLKGIVAAVGYQVTGIAVSVAEALALVAKEKPDFVLLDIYLHGKKNGIDLANMLVGMNIPFIYLSANSNQDVLEAAKQTNPYGFVVKPFREYDVLVALDIANHRFESHKKNELRQSALLQKRIANLITASDPFPQQLLALGNALQSDIPFDLFSIVIKSEQAAFKDLSLLRVAFNEYQVIGEKELEVITNLSVGEQKLLKAEDKKPEILANWYNEDELPQLAKNSPFRGLAISAFSLKSHLALPLFLNNGLVLYFYFYSRKPNTYNEEHLILINKLKQVLSEFSENVLLNAQYMESKSIAVSTGQKSFQKELSTPVFEGIIGNSHLLLNVFDQVMQVAPADSSVLLLGESGTGKEKIADRIHYLSPRKDKPFIKINCATLPANLIDTELFGHEKGAFTNAFEKKIGKFEQAHTGTIFLDEIGEIPIELQVKLLRVLQEKEIERIGGTTVIKTDVRIIAATNRNLEREVAEGRFRLDLYYRLNVFPIEMPALRYRKADIKLLTAHFIDHFNKKLGRNVTSVSSKSLANMENYNWPGNIRELENIIERNMLLAKGALLDNITFAKPITPNFTYDSHYEVSTMTENERNHILTALKKCNGKIWGSGGAAALLDIPPTTLNSKMKKLGIRKDAIDY